MHLMSVPQCSQPAVAAVEQLLAVREHMVLAVQLASQQVVALVLPQLALAGVLVQKVPELPDVVQQPLQQAEVVQQPLKPAQVSALHLHRCLLLLTSAPKAPGVSLQAVGFSLQAPGFSLQSRHSAHLHSPNQTLRFRCLQL